MVRSRGFEPPQDCSHWHLKPACLPFHHDRIKSYPSYRCLKPQIYCLLPYQFGHPRTKFFTKELSAGLRIRTLMFNVCIESKGTTLIFKEQCPGGDLHSHKLYAHGILSPACLHSTTRAKSSRRPGLNRELSGLQSDALPLGHVDIKRKTPLGLGPGEVFMSFFFYYLKTITDPIL